MESRRFALFMFLTATSTVVSSGCAAGTSAPFHVYQSPLLAAERSNPRPASRDYDPTQPAQPRETVVASNNGTLNQSEPSAPNKRSGSDSQRTPSLPALAIGGRDNDAQTSSTRDTDYAPSLAAAYVHKTFEVNGVAMPATAENSIAGLWDACRKSKTAHQGKPLPGDAAFFHNVFDANRDGRNNDWYTHVAVVVDVSDDGTATLLGWRGGRVVEHKLNTTRPDDMDRNARLRTPTADDAPFTQYHAGQLFAGWCTALDGKRDVIVMDSWAPEGR